jgi:hypothetical protein
MKPSHIDAVSLHAMPQTSSTPNGVPTMALRIASPKLSASHRVAFRVCASVSGSAMVRLAHRLQQQPQLQNVLLHAPEPSTGSDRCTPTRLREVS